MTPTGVYIRIVGSTKTPHWLPHFVPDSLLLQEIAYQTFINGVASSLHKHKKEIWPQFSLITPVGKIENFKQAREEVNILSSNKFWVIFLQKTWPPREIERTSPTSQNSMELLPWKLVSRGVKSTVGFFQIKNPYSRPNVSNWQRSRTKESHRGEK